jgi:polyribonucleotide nucleotidyltransferase
VRLLAKTEEQQQENTSDERYKGKLSEQAEKKAQRQTQTMEKIMKEYKVDEVAKLARTKVESELLEGELPKTRTEFEKAVKLLEKSRPSLVKFVLRLDGHYLSGINPNFDTLYKLVMALADTPEF